MKILIAASLVWCFGVSLYWLVSCRTDLTNDPLALYVISSEFAKGDYSSFTSGDTYLGFYPFQMGILAFYERIIRITNFLHLSFLNYRVIQLTNIPLGCVIVLSIYKITDLLFKSKSTRFFLLIIINGCLPIFIYSSFVYGEIPSAAFIFLGIWMLLQYLEKHKLWIGGLSVLSIGVGVVIRESNAILLIALTIIFILYIMNKRNYKQFILLLLILAVSITTPKLIIKHYENITGDSIGDGVPVTSLIAMGLQDSSIAAGWYNKFHHDTFVKAGFDTELDNQMCIESIKESLKYYSNHPKEATSFFTEKFLTQTVDGSVNAIYSTNLARPQNSLFKSIYFGSGYEKILFYMNSMQMMVYFFVCCSIAGFYIEYKKTKEFNVFTLLFIVTVLGGVIFQMIWEANSRYFFNYYVMMLPYAAAGVEKTCAFIFSKRNKTVSKEIPVI
jgi:4-amino-4-deoxy-L-arabinose transferase-like glycosyltransferase